jgi:hypothetical protein
MPSHGKSARKGKRPPARAPSDARAALSRFLSPPPDASFITPIEQLIECPEVLAASDALHRAIHVDLETDAVRPLSGPGALLPP